MSTDNPKNRDLITDEPGSHPVGTSVGTLAGVATGAAAGAIGGPAGVIIGAIVGGFAGGLAGHHVGEGINPTEGAVSDDENVVGTGMGLTTGAIIGGTLGIPAGPLGVAAGAAIGAGLGGYAGGEVEEALDNRDSDNKVQHVHKHVEVATTHRVVPVDTVLTNNHTDSVSNAHANTTTGYASPSLNNTVQNHTLGSTLDNPSVTKVEHTETTYVNKDTKI